MAGRLASRIQTEVAGRSSRIGCSRDWTLTSHARRIDEGVTLPGNVEYTQKLLEKFQPHLLRIDIQGLTRERSATDAGRLL